MRLRVPRGEIVAFDDAIQGRVAQDVGTEVGDVVLRRADGFWAYQLAVVVDDAAQAITDVVRGADLLDSTPRQILLQRALGLPTPRYAHLPLIVDAQGRKLSKSTGRGADRRRRPPSRAAHGLARAGPGPGGAGIVHRRQRNARRGARSLLAFAHSVGIRCVAQHRCRNRVLDWTDRL